MISLKNFNNNISNNLYPIIEKINKSERISNDEALILFNNASLSLLGLLANNIRNKIHGDITYFNKNIHIEPTNICVFDCKFCAYSRKLTKKEESWEFTQKEMIQTIIDHEDQKITEVHIVGGVHPKMGLDYFVSLIKEVKKVRPNIHVKAFTAVELEFMCRKAKVSYEKGLKILKEAGQDSLPGGGAEIFDEKIRKKICKDKCSSIQWLKIHETAHNIGMASNATILYGHYESGKEIIDHMDRLRNLQDKTNGFNAFIPLKFRNGNNQMSELKEVSIIDDLKIFAFSRIYLDNFKHIKAYWPMIGKETSQSLLSFGVNDIDGTIHDTTKIYSMAGAEEQNPTMNTKEIISLIKSVGRKPVERDTIYNTIKEY
tara:strand:+ start:5774 stop:6892 length:1119 start_codon:yes stop_codon:yes gene_type:complete